MSAHQEKRKNLFIEALKETGIYVITDEKMAKKSLAQIAKECIEGGGRVIQFRSKELSDRELFLQTKEAQKFRNNNTIFIMNDRVDMAYLLDMDGIHLGQDDLPVAEARKLLGNAAIIGLSTHNEKQFLNALKEEVDYIAIGPIYPTKTKITNNIPLGINFLKAVRNLTDKILVAIGGINLDKAQEIWSVGIDAVAVVSNIMTSENIPKTISEYIQEFKKIEKIKSI